MSSLSDAFIQAAAARYLASEMRICAHGNPFLVFPRKHEAVGDLKIYDKGGAELMFQVGELAHHHFASYYYGSEEGWERQLTSDAIAFLDRIFFGQDRILAAGPSGRYVRARNKKTARVSGCRKICVVWSAVGRTYSAI